MGSYVGWVEWVNANRYLTRTVGRIFNDNASWLDGMKPNIPTQPVISSWISLESGKFHAESNIYYYLGCLIFRLALFNPTYIGL